ncbi:Transcriptional repressor tup11 [Schizosaccharomyces pombe]
MASVEDATKVQEMLDALKAEYNALAHHSFASKARGNDYESSMIQSQIQEIEAFRKTVDDMYEKQKSVRETYEKDINKLKRELEELGVEANTASYRNRGERSELAASNNQVTHIDQEHPSQTKSTSQPPSNHLPAFQQIPPIHQSAYPQNNVAEVLMPPIPPSVEASSGQNFNQGIASQNPAISTSNLPSTTPLYIPPVNYGANQVSQQPNPQLPGVSNYYNPSATSKPAVNVQPPRIPTKATPSAEPSMTASANAGSISQAGPDGEYQGREQIAPVSDTEAARKTTSQSWYVTYNPACKRVFNINLVHTLEHPSVVCCVKFSNNGKYLATGCNQAANVFDVQTGKKLFTLHEESPDPSRDLYVRTIAFSPDGKYLVTGTEDRQIKLWDLSTQKVRYVFSGHEQDIYSLDFSHNGRFIVSGSGDRTARLWDVETGQCILKLEIENGVTAIAISPNDQFIAVGSLDQIIRVWSVSGTLVERLEGHKESVYSIAFSPDSSILLSGSLDKTIKVWELQATRSVGLSAIKPEGICKATYTGHTDFVLSVAVSPDSRWGLSGSKDRSMQFWDLQTGQSYLTCQGHKNSVISVCFSPDGRQFASGSGDLRARIWSIDPASP